MLRSLGFYCSICKGDYNSIFPRLPAGKSLFYYRGNKTGCQTNHEKSYCHCKGSPKKRNGVKCELYTKMSQQPEFSGSNDGWKEIRYKQQTDPNTQTTECKIKQNNSTANESLNNVITLPEDDEAVDYEYDPKPLPNITISWPTTTGKTEKEVVRYCNDKIRNSAPGKVCKKISGFDFTSFLQQCIDDIKVRSGIRTNLTLNVITNTPRNAANVKKLALVQVVVC